MFCLFFMETNTLNITNTQTPLSEENKQRLIQMTHISLSLDRYDDIFSDFDSRPYSQRSLSDDFLSEARKVSKDRPSGIIELKFLIPTGKRFIAHEAIIKKRLRDYFKSQYDLLNKEINGLIKQGIVFVLLGVFFMFTSSFILFKYHQEMNFLVSFLTTLFEPAGWFLFWEGMSLVIFKSKLKKPDMEFNKKMSKCEIRFFAY